MVLPWAELRWCSSDTEWIRRITVLGGGSRVTTAVGDCRKIERVGRAQMTWPSYVGTAVGGVSFDRERLKRTAVGASGRDPGDPSRLSRVAAFSGVSRTRLYSVAGLRTEFVYYDGDGYNRCCADRPKLLCFPIVLRVLSNILDHPSSRRSDPPPYLDVSYRALCQVQRRRKEMNNRPPHVSFHSPNKRSIYTV